jgi:hypothetical protein
MEKEGSNQSKKLDATNFLMVAEPTKKGPFEFSERRIYMIFSEKTHSRSLQFSSSPCPVFPKIQFSSDWSMAAEVGYL